MNIEAAKYTKGAIYMHWGLAILMIVMLFLGEDMIQHPTATFYPSLHVTLGIAILVLTLVRLWWRLTHKPPALPATMKGWEVKVSQILVILHVLAALKHQFWDKDNLLRRMSPH